MSDMTQAIVTPFLAPMFISMVFATTLHVSILQAWYYYTHQNDKWPLKLLVAAVIICNTTHEAVTTHTVYMYGVAFWGDLPKFLTLVWSLVLQAVFGGLTTFLVQSFMIMRLWRLSGHNIPLVIFTSLIVLSQLVSAFIISIIGIRRRTLDGLVELRPWSLTVLTLAAVGDVIIAVALCILLHRSRTGWQRSDLLISKLIMFTINTGVITSLYAVASFVAYLASPNTTLYVAFYFSVARLYANSLLATLNARQEIRGSMDNIHNFDTEPTGKVTLSLRSFSNPANSQQSAPPNNISININTTKETVTDLMHDDQEQAHDMEKVARLRTSSMSLGIDNDKKHGDFL